MAALAHVDESDSGWSSDDGWGDFEPLQPIQSVPAVPQTRIEDATVPTWSQAALEKLPELLSLVNFVENIWGYSLFRCEPANKQYPGIAFGATTFQSAHVSVQLKNTKSCVHMRTPDIKDRGLQHTRLDSGIVVRPEGVIHFKKKCLDKQTKKDLAFELGKGYLSFTGDNEPEFVFVVVPFENGAYVPSKAFRSPPFRVFSKRQQRFLGHKHKRQKRNVEIQKMDTDLHDAVTTLRALDQTLQRETFLNQQMLAFFDDMRAAIHSVQDATAKTALEYALRQMQTSEVATL